MCTPTMKFVRKASIFIDFIECVYIDVRSTGLLATPEAVSVE